MLLATDILFDCNPLNAIHSTYGHCLGNILQNGTKITIFVARFPSFFELLERYEFFMALSLLSIITKLSVKNTANPEIFQSGL